MSLHRLRPRARLAASALALAALAGAVPSATRAGTPTYSITFHAITAGGSAMRSSTCYGLSGTIGQAAPGYSSANTYSIVAGFWTGGVSASDEIFFNGFEGCGS
jgi:hypothetical protein